MFNVVVHPLVQNGTPCPGILRKQNVSAPNNASGTDPRRMIKGSRKLLNCAASTRKISTAERMNIGRNLFPSPRSCRDPPQRLIERQERSAHELHRVELLEAIQRPRLSLAHQRRECAQRDELSVR